MIQLTEKEDLRDKTMEIVYQASFYPLIRQPKELIQVLKTKIPDQIIPPAHQMVIRTTEIISIKETPTTTQIEFQPVITTEIRIHLRITTGIPTVHMEEPIPISVLREIQITAIPTKQIIMVLPMFSIHTILQLNQATPM